MLHTQRAQTSTSNKFSITNWIHPMQLEELWQIIWNAENLKLTWQCSFFFYWFTDLKKEKKTIVEECFHFLTIHRAQQKSEKTDFHNHSLSCWADQSREKCERSHESQNITCITQLNRTSSTLSLLRAARTQHERGVHNLWKEAQHVNHWVNNLQNSAV